MTRDRELVSDTERNRALIDIIENTRREIPVKIECLL